MSSQDSTTLQEPHERIQEWWDDELESETNSYSNGAKDLKEVRDYEEEDEEEIETAKCYPAGYEQDDDDDDDDDYDFGVESIAEQIPSGIANRIYELYGDALERVF